MADDQSNDTRPERVRAIDDSAKTLAVETVRAITGLLVAFAVAWWISEWVDLRGGFGGFAASAGVFLVIALCALTFTSGLPIQRALTAQRLAIARQKDELESVARRHQFTSDLAAALEMAEHEPDVLQVTGRALDLISEGPGELLLADSSRTHIREAAVSVTGGSPGCGVSTPWGCPAVRRGQTLEFTDSHALATCPHLQVRPDEVSALCVPVTILGTPTGVIHLTDQPRHHFDGSQLTRAEALATQAGARIGLLRAMATSQLAAATDALTGQLNRRSIEEALHRLDNEGTPYAVAFADLDHFKILNDTNGHAAGDRALRHFATITASSVRNGDMVCRFGGEEFLIVYVGCDVTEAAPIVHRLRAALAASVAAAGVPPFTVSVGLADSTYAVTAAEIISIADSGLLTAKREGRDQLIIAPKPDSVDRSPLAGSELSG
jgi:diguanylate cyclase (GGDEF)-like protein